MTNIIESISTNCQDCYRCVRACPVKAIRISHAQAKIVDSLCVHCGVCVRECPKKAKITISQLAEVRELLHSGAMVAASVDPAFAARFPGWKQLRLPSALRLLGFAHVAETAEGAQLVAKEAARLQGRGHCLSTACPVVVEYVEKYRPEYLDMLLPLVSPMIAHGRLLKQRYGAACRVVFIGPCTARKQEARRAEYKGIIDNVLTFDELADWLDEENIDLAHCEESGFESYGDLAKARLFPISGGLLKTSCGYADATDTQQLLISGNEDMQELLDMPASQWGCSLAEALFCRGGCINGPCFSPSGECGNIFSRRQQILDYSSSAGSLPALPDSQPHLEAVFHADPVWGDEVAERDIDRVFEQTDKSNPELQLNCGACGYDSCRDKAVAVLRGMAEPQMCMPFMRRQAVKRADKIIEASPSAFVLLDNELKLLHFNPAFARMFHCGKEMLGRRLSSILDDSGFEELVAGSAARCEAVKEKNGFHYQELLYSLPEDGQYVGVYTDLSQNKYDEKQLDLFKQQAVKQAQELLDHQIRFAQEMANFLGRSTAQNEEMVRQLIEICDFDSAQAEDGGGQQ